MENIRQENFIGDNTRENNDYQNLPYNKVEDNFKQDFTENITESVIQEDLNEFDDDSHHQQEEHVDSSVHNDQDIQNSGRFFEKFKALNDSIIASVKKYPPTSKPGPKGHPMCDRYFLNFNLARFNDLYLDDGSNNRTDDGQTVVHAIVKILNLVTELDDVIGRSFENNALTLAVGDDPKSILDWNNCPYAKVIEYDLPKKFEQDGFIRSLIIEKFKKHCMTLKVSMFGACYIFDGDLLLP